MKQMQWVLLAVLCVAGLAEAAGPRVKIVDPLEPLYKDTKFADAPEMPKGRQGGTVFDVPVYGLVAMHLLVTDLKVGETVRIEYLGFDGFPWYAEIDRLVAVPVEVNTGVKTRTETWDGKKNSDVIRRAPFWIYEAYLPMVCVESNTRGKRRVFSCKATSKTMAFSIRQPKMSITSRWGIKPKGRVVVGTQAGATTLPVQINFSGHVNDVLSRSMGYTNWLNYNNVAGKYHGLNGKMWSEPWWGMMEKYIVLLAKNRQNMIRMPVIDLFTRDAKGAYKLNTARLDRFVKLCDTYGIYWLEGKQIGGRPKGDWSTTKIQLRFGKDILAPSPEAAAMVADVCGKLYAHLKTRGWDKRWLQHLSDEPTDKNAAAFVWLAKEVRKAMPGARIFEATISLKLVGGVDVWCPTVDEWQKHRKFFDARKAAGDDVWVYTCLTPTGPWVNRLLDQERLRCVWVGWGVAKYNLDGYLHWGGNYWNADPYKQSVVKHPAVRVENPGTKNELPAGDTHVLFPGKNAVYGSVRLTAHTIGCEDHDLLKVLMKKDPKRAKAIIAKVFRAWDDYEKSVPKYRAARRELLEALSKPVK